MPLNTAAASSACVMLVVVLVACRMAIASTIQTASCGMVLGGSASSSNALSSVAFTVLMGPPSGVAMERAHSQMGSLGVFLQKAHEFGQ